MEQSPSKQETIRHQFDSFCRKILREESRNYKKHLMRRVQTELYFSELSQTDVRTLYTRDEYPSDQTFFDVMGYRVAIKDERLAKALNQLPSKKRDVILLLYFLDMSDAEIAKKLKVVYSTIYRRRISSLKELKLRLEGLKDEESI